jgi:hypothetical protein
MNANSQELRITRMVEFARHGTTFQQSPDGNACVTRHSMATLAALNAAWAKSRDTSRHVAKSNAGHHNPHVNVSVGHSGANAMILIDPKTNHIFAESESLTQALASAGLLLNVACVVNMEDSALVKLIGGAQLWFVNRCTCVHFACGLHHQVIA